MENFFKKINQGKGRTHDVRFGAKELISCKLGLLE